MAANTSPLDPYKFKALSATDSLRLLKLRPGASQNDIDCELFEAHLVDLDQFEQGTCAEDYEALSWCWGDLPQDRPLRINEGEQAYQFLISQDLESALRALRYVDRTRLLWVDAICINQKNLTERNQQVPRMNQIYGQARNVCIWIGDADETSHRAMEFIKEKVLKLWDFDKLCEDSKMGERWQAMSKLMKRPWFSRRWVVQEIALAERGILYCGEDSILWQEFADAVSLFVEAESSTHKLSKVMRKDQNFDQIPDFYGNVPALGAARLVDATSNLFRSSKTGARERRERLLSLEYLVSKYTVFEAREPRDTIYALLAIARDTTPQAIQQEPPEEFQRLPQAARQQLGRWFRQDFVSKVYPVDYNAPPIEVYKDFIAFSISKSEPKCALNIICRPWAPRLTSHANQSRVTEVATDANGLAPLSPKSSVGVREILTLPSWIPDMSGAAFVMQQHANAAAGERMDRSNADPLVGMPGDRTYSAAGTKPISIRKLKWLNHGDYYSMFVEGFVFDTIAKKEEVSRAGIISPKWLELAHWDNTNDDPPEEFWRTLVADRGPNGQNTQPFYARACKEAMTKRPPDRGVLETKVVIEHGRCSIIAEFLRRVQAVIWNRRLMRTERGHLGLVHEDSDEGDFICILYGCNVPVILRRHKKTAATIDKERLEAEVEQERKDKEAINKVRAAFRGNRRSSSTLQLIWRNPIVMQLFWAGAIVMFAEYRHGFTLRGAALLNSFLLVMPQPFEKIRKSMDSKAWKRFRMWIHGGRLLCTAFLVLHMASWIDYVIEGAFLAVVLAVLLPSFFLSDENSKYVLTGKWIYALREKCINKLRSPHELVEDKAVPEPEHYYWQLIGECYVDGMMDGEAIAFQNQNWADIGPQIFELR